MRNIQSIPAKILTLTAATRIVNGWKALGKTVAFTNGVFDLLHAGHIFSLSEAAKEADYLVVGINNDASVQRLKGPTRPVQDQDTRALVVAGLQIVDLVIVFEEDTPYTLITSLLPNVLVKGGDYTIDTIVGAKEVIQHGGRVVVNPIMEGHSTTSLIAKMNQK